MTAAFQKIADAWKQRTILAKLFSFASIGVINVVIDLSVFTIALQIIHLPLVASNVVAWAVAVTGSYAMNTKITFGKETGGALSVGHYLRFAASGILGVTVATTVLVILSRYIGFFPFRQPLVSQALAVLLDIDAFCPKQLAHGSIKLIPLDTKLPSRQRRRFRPLLSEA
jgi:putative flippase GtrA